MFHTLVFAENGRDEKVTSGSFHRSTDGVLSPDAVNTTTTNQAAGVCSPAGSTTAAGILSPAGRITPAGGVSPASPLSQLSGRSWLLGRRLPLAGTTSAGSCGQQMNKTKD